MAKKSNKTEHVLKLITKNEDETGMDNLFSIPREVSGNDSSAEQKPKNEKRIKESAEAIAKPPAEPPEPAQPVPEVPEPSATEVPAQPVPEVPEPSATEVPAQPAQEVPAQPVPEVPEPSAPAQPTEPPTLRAFREQEKAGSAILEQNDNLVNIAETLTREKLSLVMERMKVCTCKTCVNDVLALALNSLPTKYVTTDAGKQYFQLDIYKKQYETDILAALTKACVRVKASPRH